MPGLRQKATTKYMGKLVKPEGKANMAQSLAKNFIDLAMAKPQKFFIQILYHLCLL